MSKRFSTLYEAIFSWVALRKRGIKKRRRKRIKILYAFPTRRLGTRNI